jgi:hypothetical protein
MMRSVSSALARHQASSSRSLQAPTCPSAPCAAMPATWLCTSRHASFSLASRASRAASDAAMALRTDLRTRRPMPQIQRPGQQACEVARVAAQQARGRAGLVGPLGAGALGPGSVQALLRLALLCLQRRRPCLQALALLLALPVQLHRLLQRPLRRLLLRRGSGLALLRCLQGRVGGRVGSMRHARQLPASLLEVWAATVWVSTPFSPPLWVPQGRPRPHTARSARAPPAGAVPASPARGRRPRHRLTCTAACSSAARATLSRSLPAAAASASLTRASLAASSSPLCAASPCSSSSSCCSLASVACSRWSCGGGGGGGRGL